MVAGARFSFLIKLQQGIYLFRTYTVNIEKPRLRLDVSLDGVKKKIDSVIETSGGHLRQDVTLDQVRQDINLDPVRQDINLDPVRQNGIPRAPQPHPLEATNGRGPLENDNQRMQSGAS